MCRWIAAAVLVWAPPLQKLFGTASIEPVYLAVLPPFPFVVWGADEFRRYVIRKSERRLHPRLIDEIRRPHEQ